MFDLIECECVIDIGREIKKKENDCLMSREWRRRSGLNNEINLAFAVRLFSIPFLGQFFHSLVDLTVRILIGVILLMLIRSDLISDGSQLS